MQVGKQDGDLGLVCTASSRNMSRGLCSIAAGPHDGAALVY